MHPFGIRDKVRGLAVAALLALLKIPLVRKALLAGLLMIAAYSKGGADCAVKHERKAAQKAQEWAEEVIGVSERAFDRGAQSAAVDQDNEEKVDDIVRNAGMELGAKDECWSANTVERLRALQ